ncbi:excinuclease ABC subunit UvrC [Ureaplasma miroungigenitalium]|uniref:UvrABC system protein C n=1 Tax=Ureaplasma miroungigenitalium TaxID=1042321 RepID=A0ABT3BLX4_9BACT|nr:excinuclease ABC subunit UvrC [Ureaplasma miroungigenitalium]MCV3728250.1 excinuclease ABC subunit UvrC [Ureaplasma miroungigenitalium]
MQSVSILQQLTNIPKQPGCYLWKNSHNEIIYVGKAKNLFDRMHSYFYEHNNFKTQQLVKQIAGFDYIVVHNANEALILENNLIKKHKPRFNILLKEGNFYPYICVTNEKHPRLIYQRIYNPKIGTFYGPIADKTSHKYDLLILLNNLYPFKKCKQPEDKPCMFYHLQQCIAHHVSNETFAKYEQFKKEIASLFKGDVAGLITTLKEKEQFAASKWDFESAKKYFNQQQSLLNLQVASLVQLDIENNFDVIGYYLENGYLVINIFRYQEGNLLSKHIFYDSIIVDDLNEMLVSYLIQYYSLHKQSRCLIYLPDDQLKFLKSSLNQVFEIPQNKKEQSILEMAVYNARAYYDSHLHSLIQNKNNVQNNWTQLSTLVNIPNLQTVEIFDNSNIFLDLPISGMIVYVNGEINHRLKRKYNLQTKELQSDYHFMYEVIKRRYTHLENTPDLIIVDGGISQVNAAQKALQEIQRSIPIIGFKKDDNHQTHAIVFTDKQEYDFDRRSSFYKYCAKMQDEVHNWAISFLRKKQTKKMTHSFLDEIPGIGPKTKAKIMQYYRDIDHLKQASLSSLEQILSKKVAQTLFTFLQSYK